MHKIIKRKTFSKILVALHESRTSVDTATDFAIKIAQDYDAQLVILHVIRTDVNLYNVNLPSHVMEMKIQAQDHFKKIAEKIHEDNSNKENILRMKTEIIASVSIANAIVSYAKDKQIELIVIESRDISRLKSVLLGNVASDVVKYAHCAVLTVK
jgi:nucleotide-binding universal stress UspA family protein